MDFSTAVRTAVSRFGQFGGRSCRAEYWYFRLAVVLAELAGFMIYGLAIVIRFTPLSALVGLALFVFLIAAVIASLAVSFRRMHDINKSAWLLLIAFIPLLGPILLLIWFCQPGERVANQYGPDPLAPPVSAAEHFA